MVSNMNKIDKLVYELINRYKTRDPVAICSSMNINVIRVDLPKSINSFHIKIFKKDTILINDKISKKIATISCAKELAHIIIDTCNDPAGFINYSKPDNDHSIDYYDYFAAKLIFGKDIDTSEYDLFNVI